MLTEGDRADPDGPARRPYLPSTMDVTSPRRVGRTDLLVTPLGFGAGPLGDPGLADEVCLATVEAAWASGVRFFDTAPDYGLGRSERRLGMALANHDRDDFCINTKVGKSLVPEPVRDPSQKTLSPQGEVRTPRDPRSRFRSHYDYGHDAILQQHQDSMQRLGLASVDSLTIHDLDHGYHSKAQVAEHLDQLSRNGGGGALALEALRETGAIRAIGLGCNLESRNAGSWVGQEHEELIEQIAARVDLDFLVVAGPYTLLDTRALRRLAALCEKRGIGWIGASPYAGGWLVGDETTPYMYGQAPPEIIERSQAIRQLCEAHGASLAAAALQFPLAHPLVATVIPGARSPAEALLTRERLHAPVPVELWEALVREGLLDPAAPTPA